MNYKFKTLLFSLTFFAFFACAVISGFAQETEPKPTPPAKPPSVKPAPSDKRSKKGNRTSGVKLKADDGDSSAVAPVNNATDGDIPQPSKEELEKLEKGREEQRRTAEAETEAVLERERQKVRDESEKRENDLKATFEAEKLRLTAENKITESERARLETENVKTDEERKRLEAEKIIREQETLVLRQKLTNEEGLRQKAETLIQTTEEEAKLKAQSEAEQSRLAAKKQIEQTALDAENKAKEVRLETEKQIEQSRLDAEKKVEEIRLEAEERAAEREKETDKQIEQAKIEAETKALTIAQKATTDKEKLRHALIFEKARDLGYLAPDGAVAVVPAEVVDASEIEEILREHAKQNSSLVKVLNFCSPDFVGEKFTFDVPSQQSLSTLLNEIRIRYGVNFLPDSEIVDQSVQVNVNDVPWNFVLKSQLFNLDVEAVCYGNNTVSLIKRSKLLTLQDSQRKTAPTRTEYIKLRYLRPLIAGQSNLAGKTTSAASIESLEQTIQKILTADGDKRGSISRIPGRAEFFITATDVQLEQIRQVIAKADRPTYRVDVFGLVYTVNESRLKDVGSQLSLIVRSGGRVGGLTTLPDPPATGGDDTTPTENRGLPAQFAQPGGLQAGAPNTILGAQVRLGLVDFNYQLSLLEQLGVARRVEKPFVSAKDGTTGTFENGTQIPVIIQSLNNFSGGGGGSIEFINAGTTLSVTPQVIEGEDGVPKLVNLALRLESNTPDLSIRTTGSVPSVNSRRIQNEITIAPNQAFIFGGSNDVFDANNVSRTPLLGNLPILGNLFRRKTTQLADNKLYFAVWVQISLDDGTSPVETDTLNTTFPKPPKMDAPLVLPSKKP